MLNMQYLLRKSDYSFLKYDSVLSATRFIEAKVDDIIKSIREEQTRFVSNLTETDSGNIISMIEKSVLFKPSDKEIYLR